MLPGLSFCSYKTQVTIIITESNPLKKNQVSRRVNPELRKTSELSSFSYKVNSCYRSFCVQKRNNHIGVMSKSDIRSNDVDWPCRDGRWKMWESKLKCHKEISIKFSLETSGFLHQLKHDTNI